MPDLAFAENERILCFHGPLLYEAKVLKGEMWTGKPNPEDDGPHYFIHYKGWKQTWDEWVPESRTLKYTEENLKMQADLNESLSAKKNKSHEKKAAAETSSDKSSSKKRPRDSGEKEDEYLKRPEIKIALPESLKIQLVDDWEDVTKNQKLVSLPRNPNVTTIIRQYKEAALKKSSTKESFQADVIAEFVEGLKCYFDKALGNILLYRFERQQYVELRKKFPEKDMADVYGAEHLLRLFVQLPQLIAHTNMDQDTIALLKDQFAEFLKYLEAHSSDLFLSSYENASPTYIAVSKNQ
ncbi:Esa1p-associated factor [Chytridiales sp. JEL 0842]|nr:Esa1p-associated factor [Chytridiales sp. JEL 0842]